jgi:hypothetical protein
MTLTAMVRSFVQYAVGAILAAAPVMAALNWVTEEVGIPVDTAAIRVWVEGLVFALVVGLLIKLGEKFPWINNVISLGRSASSPVYVPAGDTTVAATVTPAEGTTVFTEEGEGQPAPPVFEENPKP